MPYTPKQNDVIKWKNMPLQECVKNMLKQAKFPYYFWVEAIGWQYIYKI
jgi:hypothetical protein